MRENKTLWMVIPCYNEEEVLPITAPMFLEQLNKMMESGKISAESKILFVNDGSKDKTWEIICALAKENSHFVGICQSRNRSFITAFFVMGVSTLFRKHKEQMMGVLKKCFLE